VAVPTPTAPNDKVRALRFACTPVRLLQFSPMPVRSIADLLRAQPQEELEAMAKGMRDEIARLQRDLEIVETALAPLSRRRNRPSNGSNANLGPGLKRDDLFRFVAEQGRPISPTEMREILVNQGYDIATSAVRTGMSRLVKDKRLVRLEDGVYAVSTATDGSGLETEAPDTAGTLGFEELGRT
jgi:hypothetical protein